MTEVEPSMINTLLLC